MKTLATYLVLGIGAFAVAPVALTAHEPSGHLQEAPVPAAAKPEIRLSVSNPTPVQGERFDLIITLSNPGSEPMRLDRRCWDPEATTAGSTRVWISTPRRTGFNSYAVRPGFLGHHLPPLGTMEGLPEELVVEIPGGGEVEYRVPLGGPLSRESLDCHSSFAEPGQYVLKYTPWFPPPPGERWTTSHTGLELAASFQVPLESIGTAAGHSLEQLAASGGDLWYAALMAAAKSSPDQVLALLGSDLPPARVQDAVVSLAHADPSDEMAAGIAAYLDSCRTPDEQQLVLNSVRQWMDPKSLPILESLIERNVGGDEKSSILRAGAAFAALQIDRKEGRRLALKVIAIAETHERAGTIVSEGADEIEVLQSLVEIDGGGGPQGTRSE